MGDSGSIVFGWLTKLAVLFGVLGLLAFDGISLVVANFGAADDATTAANAAADVFKSTKNVQQSYDAAVNAVSGKGDIVETQTFRVNPDGSVSLVVDRTPTTLWMHHLGALKSWLHVHQSGSGSPPS